MFSIEELKLIKEELKINEDKYSEEKIKLRIDSYSKNKYSYKKQEEIVKEIYNMVDKSNKLHMIITKLNKVIEEEILKEKKLKDPIKNIIKEYE